MRGLGTLTTRRLSAAPTRAYLEGGLHEQGRAPRRRRLSGRLQWRGVARRVTLNAMELSAKAFTRPSRGTMLGDEGHSRRIADDPCEAHEENEREDVPRLEVSGQDYRREYQRDRGLVAVYEGHELSAVEVVNEKAADRADEQYGQSVQPERDARPEGGGGDFVG